MINTQKIKGRMVELKVTQFDLAKEIGCQACTISQKINNKRAMSLDEADVISKLLNIGAEDFGTYFFSHPVA